VHAHGIYDLEVDTSIYIPEECALKIKARLQTGYPPDAFKRLKQRKLVNRADVGRNGNQTSHLDSLDTS